MMKCVKLTKTSAPTDLKDVSYLELMPAQAAFEKFAKDAERKASHSAKRRRAWIEMKKSKNESEDERASKLASRRSNVGDRVATLGSEGVVYCQQDDGLFSAVLTAYNNHWKLKTSPEDWWYCVIRRVALAIDANAGKKNVRRMFVEHEGKKTLCVGVPTTCIYDVDYDLFFQAMSEEISKNVKVPEYVDVVTADFTTTSSTMKIASQITIMSSLQEFFDYGMCTLCGIPAIEMLGTEDDWARLGEKLRALKEILKPIHHDIGLRDEWWSCAEKVFEKLLKTYQGSPDKDWWDKIIHFKGSGRSGGPLPGYTGWLTEFIEGTTSLIPSHRFTSGLVTVPLSIKRIDGVEDTAALVAGMLGFTIHKGDVPSVQAFHGWSLLLPEHSPLRSKTAA